MTASSGISSCARTTSGAGSRPSSRSTSAAVSIPFAPGITTMVFAPSGSTVMWAAPVGDVVAHADAADVDPLARQGVGERRPSGSAPTQPTIATPTPWRAADTA